MRYISYKTVIPRTVAAIPITLFVILPAFTTNVITLSIIISSGIWAIAAMGFTLILRTGQFSLGQAAFMAIGGYASAIFTVKLGFPFWPSFFLAGVVSGIIALIIGSIVLRVGGIYFSIITLALGEVVRIIAQQWEPVTKGSRGLITSPPDPIILGSFEINFAASVVPYYYFLILLVALSGLVFWQIGRSRLGGIFFSMAANQILAEHQGIYLMKYRVIAFTVAGVFTGFAGAYYVHFLSTITPIMLGLWESIQIMIMGIVGGVSSLVGGPLIGSLVLYTLGIYLSRLPVFGIQQLLFGAAVVLVLLFLPKGTGLVDLWDKFWRKVFREPAYEDYEEPPPE
jgi:branched-chain amino acid transport system permease protein